MEDKMNIKSKIKINHCYHICLYCNRNLSLFTKVDYFYVINDAITFLNRKFKVKILGYCFLANQIQLILYFDGKTRINYIEEFKKLTRGEVIKLLAEENKHQIIDQLRFISHEQKYKVWSISFKEKKLEIKEQLVHALENIHSLPVDSGLVEDMSIYAYSSASFYSQGKETAIKISHYKNTRSF